MKVSLTKEIIIDGLITENQWLEVRLAPPSINHPENKFLAQFKGPTDRGSQYAEYVISGAYGETLDEAIARAIPLLGSGR